MLISRPRGAVNPEGGAAAACLFAVSPVQALTSSHPFLTSIYMFLILPRVNVHVMADPCQASCILMQRAALSSEQRSSLLSLRSAELQRQLIKWSCRLRSPEHRTAAYRLRLFGTCVTHVLMFVAASRRQQTSTASASGGSTTCVFACQAH